MRYLDYLINHENMSQHSIALIDPNTVQGKRMFKVACLSLSPQNWQSMNSGFLHNSIVMSLFQCPLNPCIAVKLHCLEFVPMWQNWLIKSRVRDWHSYYLLVLIDKYRDRLAGTRQQRIKHWFASGSAWSCSHPDKAPDGEIHWGRYNKRQISSMCLVWIHL